MNRFNLDEMVYIDDPNFSHSKMDEWDLNQPLIKDHTFSVRYLYFRRFIVENFLKDDTPIEGNYDYKVNIVVKNGKADWSFFPELKNKISEMEERVKEIQAIKEQDRTPLENKDLTSILYMLKPFSSITWINPLDFKESLEIFDIALNQTVITEQQNESYKKILSHAPFYIFGCNGFSFSLFPNNDVPKRLLPYGMYKLIDPTTEIVTPRSCCASLSEVEADKIKHLVSYSLEATKNPAAPKWPYNDKEQYFFPNDPPASFEQYAISNAKFKDLVESWLEYFREKKEEDEKLIKRFNASAVYFKTFNQKMYGDILSLKEDAKTSSYTYLVNNYWFDMMSKAAGVSGLPAGHCLPNLKVVPNPINIKREKVLRYVGLYQSKEIHSFPESATSRQIPVVERVVSEIDLETCELSLYSRDSSKWEYTCVINSNLHKNSVFQLLHLVSDVQVRNRSLFFGINIGESSYVAPRIKLGVREYSYPQSMDYIWTDLQAIDHLVYTDDFNTNFFSKLYSSLTNILLKYITPIVIKLLPSKLRRIYSYINIVKKYGNVIDTLDTVIDYLDLLKGCTVLDLLIEADKLLIKIDPFITTGRFFLSEKPRYELELVFRLVRVAVGKRFSEAFELIDDEYAKGLILDYLTFKLSRRILISLVS